MTLIRSTMTVAAAVGGVAAAAVGLAPAASAQLLDGTYTHTSLSDQTYTVVFTSCGDGCKHAEFPGTDIPPGEYHLSGATWTGPNRDGIVETIDDNTLATTLTAPMGPQTISLPAKLIKTG